MPIDCNDFARSNDVCWISLAWICVELASYMLALKRFTRGNEDTTQRQHLQRRLDGLPVPCPHINAPQAPGGSW